MGKRLERYREVRVVNETNGFDWTLSRRSRVDLEAPPQTIIDLVLLILQIEYRNMH